MDVGSWVTVIERNEMIEEISLKKVKNSIYINLK